MERHETRMRRSLNSSRNGLHDTRRPAGNLRALVTDAIRDAIMSGDYPPGSPLGEVELAERFGVSRGPVREALIQLEREYLVRSFPNRGCFVAALAEQEFDEILMLRRILEPKALEYARDKASAADIKEMRKRLRDLERTAASRDHRKYIGKDYEFHLALWEISRQPLLKEVLMRISAPVFVFEAIVEERYRSAAYDLQADARAHRSIVDYIAGQTALDAHECLQPVLDLAMSAEKPIVFGSGRRTGTRRTRAEAARR